MLDVTKSVGTPCLMKRRPRGSPADLPILSKASSTFVGRRVEAPSNEATVPLPVLLEHSVTDALDLCLVVPVEVLAAIQLIRVRPEGSVLALVMLIVTSVSASRSWRKVLRS
jgi:hypothetical protein